MDAGMVVVGVVVGLIGLGSAISLCLPVFLLAAAPAAAAPPEPIEQVSVSALSPLGPQAAPTLHVISALRELAAQDPSLHPVVDAHVRALVQAVDAHYTLQTHLAAHWRLDCSQSELHTMNEISWVRVQTQVSALADLHLGETRRLLEQDPSASAALEARARRMARRETG